jgi:hypothetical protein
VLQISFSVNSLVLLIMEIQKNKPLFDKRIFWDVTFEKMDYDAKASFIIERVFERGDVEDIRQCRRYYGDEKIKEVLTKAKWLSLHNIYLACALFDNEPTDYRCYITAQSNPNHFSY